jgi:hypothetical protein
MKVRKYHYEIMYKRGDAISRRPLAAETLSKVLIRSIELYKGTWGKLPDAVKINFKGSYNFE